MSKILFKNVYIHFNIYFLIDYSIPPKPQISISGSKREERRKVGLMYLPMFLVIILHIKSGYCVNVKWITNCKHLDFIVPSYISCCDQKQFNDVLVLYKRIFEATLISQTYLPVIPLPSCLSFRYSKQQFKLKKKKSLKPHRYRHKVKFLTDFRCQKCRCIHLC